MVQRRKNSRQVVGGIIKMISDTLARPADTTQYAAGDQVTDSTTAPSVLTFSNVGLYTLPESADASGVIVAATCVSSANQSTKPNFELWLFQSTHAPNNDNAAWAPSDAILNDALGVITFDSWKIGTVTSGADGNAASFVENKTIAFQCADSDEDLYGLMVARNAYTPVSAEIFTITLHIIQD